MSLDSLSPPSRVTFAATGDSFITRRLPEDCPEPCRIAAIVNEADFRFTNVETTLRRGEGFPAAQSGGTWASAAPEVLQDLKRYGFNIVAWANNHTLDYSYGGLESTGRYLDEAGFVHAGAGSSLAEAGAVRYLETRNGRVALIAATSTFHESWIAGDSRPEITGRPGVNPLRFTTVHYVSAAQLSELKAVAEACSLNAYHNQSVKEGFTPADPEGSVRFGGMIFKEGAEGMVRHPHAGDLKRIRTAIREAKRQADLVVVSIHSHEMEKAAKDRPADFLVEFSRACIDEGAHAIVGHGPHIVRGIEVYKNRPIFYSLGNFIFQNETVAQLPLDFYEKYGLGTENTLADGFDKRSANNTKGFAINPKIWESVVASWVMEKGELSEITLHPVALGHGEPRYRKGWPRLTGETAVLEDLQRLSLELGTEIRIEGGKGHWRAKD